VALAVVDACFLINWARFRQRMDLFRLFERLAVPAPVFVEVRSEPARLFVSSLLATRRLLLTPRLAKVDQLALTLFETINADPNLPVIDPPEAYALAFAKYVGAPMLTDNAAPKLATMFLEILRDVVVYDSLDVLVRLYRGSRLEAKVREFMRDTGIIFSERRLREHGLAP